MRARTAIGLLWIALLLIGRALLSPAVDTPASRLAINAGGAGVSEDGVDSRGRQEARPSHADLYGNEVSDALAEYEIDSRGTVYELHSPNTAVPKLMAPGM